MPIYVYYCNQCNTTLEKRQKYSDLQLTECEKCGGNLRKILQPSTIIYNGSGFYTTDNKENK